MRLWTNELDH
jgi:5-formyltetrahydrofolate cyclo-ligase